MRVSEACALDRPDVELAEGRLTVRLGKNRRSREIPLHPSTVQALERYARARDQLCPHPNDPAAFFLSAWGGRPSRHHVWRWFDQLRRATGLDRETLGRQARLHDIRHTFVLRTLLGWYREADDIEAQLPLLATVLGHVDPAAHTGISRAHRSCWRWPPSGSSGHERSRSLQRPRTGKHTRRSLSEGGGHDQPGRVSEGVADERAR